MLDLASKTAPDHTAVVVVDVQVDFCSPKGARARSGRDLSMIEPMIGRLRKFIRDAAQAGVLTLYSQQVYDRSKLTELQKEQYDLDGKLVTCDINCSGYNFYRINPPPGDVYRKYTYDIFSNPAPAGELTQIWRGTRR